MKNLYTSESKSGNSIRMVLKIASLMAGLVVGMVNGAMAQNTLIPLSGSNSMSSGGTLCSHAGCGSTYSNGANGYTVINGTGSSLININGSYATESCCDYIKIYNGSGTGGTQLTSYAGSGTINYTGTAGQTLTVQFYTDGSVTGTGLNSTVTYSTPGDNCSNAQDLSALASPYSGTTVGYANDISTCHTSGPDRIWYINVPNNYTITVDESALGYDGWEYMGYGGSCPGTTQITCWDNDALAANSWTNTTGSTQMVWYILDSYSGSSGTFSFDWTLVSACAAPSISSHPSTSAQNLCINGAATSLSVTASGTSLTYQWYSNTTSSNSGGSTLSGATSSSYTPVTTTAGTKYYYCIVSGACTPAVTSNVSGAINVYAIPVSGTLTPTPATGAVCLGTSVSVTAAAGSGGTGTIADILQYRYDGGSWITYTSGTSLTTTGHTSVAIQTYRTATGTGCTTSTANISSWTVNALPAISSQSTAAQTVCLNGTASAMTISATGASLTYQWYSNTTASNSGGTSLGSATGAQTASYTPLTTSAGVKYYYCIVGGTCTPTVTSSVSGAITINAIPVSGTLTPSVAAGTVCVGTSVSATATAGSGGAGTIADVLQYKYDAGSWTTYTSGTSLTTTGHTSVAIQTFRTASASGCTTSTPVVVTWTVNALPAISSQSTAAQTICLNGITTAMTVTATGTGITYQWYSNTNASNSGGTSLGSTTGAQTASYTPLTTSVGVTYYYCIVSGTCTPTVTSSVSGAITINAIPVSGTLTPSVAAGAVCVGTSVSATATAGSGGAGTIADVLQYKYDAGSWTTYTSGTSLTTTGHTSVSIQTYRTASVSGCTTSSAVVVTWTVSAMPTSGTLTPSPAAGAVCSGINVSATATAGSGGGGTTADVLQCRYDGGTWTTYTSGTSLSTTGHTSVNIQTYRTASGSGCTTSTAVVVSWTINAVPVSGTLTPSVAAGAVCSGTNLSATATSGSGGLGTIADVLQYKYDAGLWTTYTSGTSLSTTGHTSVSIQTYRTASGSGCTTSSATLLAWTVNALPTVASITGTTTVCTSFTTPLSCTTGSGVWSSNSANATVNSSGVVTGVTAGSATISYTVTNGTTGCSNASTASVIVSASLAAPTSVTATPATIQTGGTSNLNATSANNTIYWYTAASGGSSVGSSASGANFSVSPSATTTYYAEANSTQSFYINTLTANNFAVTDHNSYTGDDRGGIAVTSFYYYYTGDNYTVRYTMPNLTHPLSCTLRDGLFSDLGTGTLYTLWNGTTDPTYGTNTNPFVVTKFRTMNADLSLGDTYVTLSASVTMTQGNSAIYAGSNFVILQNGTSFYKVAIPSGTVTTLATTYTISRYASESWATWGVAELNGSTYSVLYRENSTQAIKRLNLNTGAVTTVATFTNLSDMCCFTYSPSNNRWYYHYEGSSQFGGSAETAGYADGTHTTTSTGCPSATRTAVTVTISDPPTVTTAAVSNINATTATGGGNITAQGGSSVTVSGVCWSTSQNPTTSNSKTTDGLLTGAFTTGIINLTAGTLYYVRAYATNPVGTSYGSQVSFTSYAPGSIGTNQEICSGATPALLTSTTAAIGMPSVTYQWQSSADNSTYGNITGATSLTYQSGALSAATYYRRNAISGSVTLSSNVITVSINAGVASPTSVTATPATILSGASSNLNATAAGSTIKWYDAASGGTLLNTTASAANYSVSPAATKTYYAQAAPIDCQDNTLELILSNLNTNYANITSQIPSPYAFTEGASSNYINDGGSDMYDGGNYLSTDKSTSFSYSDNTVLTSSVFGATTGKYFTRKASNLFVMAADMNNVSWFKVSGDYGTDGGGSKSSTIFSVTVGCKTFNCFLSRVYGTSDPSINELFIIPANASATHTGIANTSNSTHTLNTISASTRMFYLLYAGTSGGLISDASATNIATAFLTQTEAVINGAGGCPSAVRTAVAVTVSAIPTVTTDAVSAVAATTATGGGNVTADGGSTVTARGVCWSTSQTPVASENHTTDATGTGTFSSSITGLTAGTTYYVRAYATNAMGTNYGSQVSFTPFALGTFANINKTFGNSPFTLVNPTSTSLGTFSYSSSNTNVATITGNTVTIVGAGTTTITATQAASGAYTSTSKTCLLTVAKANQVLTLTIPTSAPLNTFIGTSLSITATSSAGLGVTVVKGAASTATATLNGTIGSYSLTNVGSTGVLVIEASQAGNDNYNSAATSQSFNVLLGNQSITFNALSPLTYSTSLNTDLTATASSTLGVTFSVVSGPGTLSAGTHLTISGAGVIVIQASQAGDASWNAAPNVIRNLTVNKATPSISFDAISKVFDDVPFTLIASSASTGAFTFSSGNTSVATISGSTAAIAGVGSSTITASLAADANYLASSANAMLTVSKADQTITLDAIKDINLIDFEGNPITVIANSTSELPVTLTLAGGSVAIVDGTQLESTIATGNVTVYANQAGNDNYNAATQVSEIFTVTKANQTITFDALPVKHVGDADFALIASTSSDLLITYVSATQAVVSINGKIVTVHSTGSSNITASQTGNIYYNAASSVMQSQVVEGEMFKNWTGTVSTYWNVAGNWNPSGVPVSTDNLIIVSTANQPHVTNVAGVPAVSNKLTINTGATLTIDAGKALTVNGVLTNSGSMLIESSAAGTGSLITYSSITNTGNINVQRYITNDLWHLISSPVTSATAFIFKDDYLQSWSEPEAKWADIVLTSTGLNPVEGYGLWTMQGAAHSYTFTGTPNTGDQSKAISYTEVPFGENKGANLLGNPYPSSIDWIGLDDTFGAVYYWQGSGTNGDGTYVSWINSIGSGSRYIPPMQGFFIVNEAAGTFFLSNSDRVHSTASYYKTSNAAQENLLVLETVSKGISDKLYLKFDESAEEGFELRSDAYKFLGNIDGVSELFSLTGDKKLSIDVRPACDVIELGFTNTLAGKYQIALNEVNGFNEAMLEDAQTGTFTNLLKDAYSFDYIPGEQDHRFKLHFATILNTADKKDVFANIYSYRKTAYINLKDNLEGDIFIYNVAGQLVAKKLSVKGMNEIGLIKTGNYIVKVVTHRTSQVKKIFIQ